MLYVEYETAKTKYEHARDVYDGLIAEKEELFQITQIKGMEYDKERVDGGSMNSLFDSYIIKKEQAKLDERINEAYDILQRRKEQLKAKKEELIASRDKYDKIYVLAELERQPQDKIAALTGYSTSQVYRILRNIKAVLRKT